MSLMFFYKLYVSFMVWLGAAPPKGYEHLLLAENRKVEPLSNIELSGFEKVIIFLLCGLFIWYCVLPFLAIAIGDIFNLTWLGD